MLNFSLNDECSIGLVDGKVRLYLEMSFLLIIVDTGWALRPVLEKKYGGGRGVGGSPHDDGVLGRGG